MQSQIRRLTAVFAVLLLLMTAVPSVFARGSFGGGGRSFGGGGRSFGGGSFGGGGRGFGGLFGGSRPSFTPAPRPSFAPSPAPTMARPSSSTGSFGRAGGIGSPVSNRFQGSNGEGGSFGRTGAAGSRTFSSIGRHDAPAPSANVGRPVAPMFDHPYNYGGRPTNAYFTGGYTDYSFGYYRHPYYAWLPWSPVFYYNPPVYTGAQYVSGGFSFVRFLVGIAFWVLVIAVVVAIVKRFRSRQSA